MNCVSKKHNSGTRVAESGESKSDEALTETLTRPLEPGEIYGKVRLKNGREAVLRAPAWSDLSDLLEMINGLVRARAEVYVVKEVTMEETARHLLERLNGVRVGDLVALVGVVDGRVVASGQVKRFPAERSHLGELAVFVAQGFQNVGLGSAIVRGLLDLAQKTAFEVVFMEVFATNTVARHVYEKSGFVEDGRLPRAIRRDGKYIDLVMMHTFLTSGSVNEDGQ